MAQRGKGKHEFYILKYVLSFWKHPNYLALELEEMLFRVPCRQNVGWIDRMILEAVRWWPGKNDPFCWEIWSLVKNKWLFIESWRPRSSLFVDQRPIEEQDWGVERAGGSSFFIIFFFQEFWDRPEKELKRLHLLLQRAWVNKVLYTVRLTISGAEPLKKSTMGIGDSFKVCWSQRLKVQLLH